MGGGEDIVDSVRDVVEGEFINGESPERGGGGGRACAFSGIFIAAIVP